MTTTESYDLALQKIPPELRASVVEVVRRRKRLLLKRARRLRTPVADDIAVSCHIALMKKGVEDDIAGHAGRLFMFMTTDSKDGSGNIDVLELADKLNNLTYEEPPA